MASHYLGAWTKTPDVQCLLVRQVDRLDCVRPQV
jgi:hypothetical protein